MNAAQQEQQAYYKNKLESGMEYQDFVVDKCYERLGLAIVLYGSRKYQLVKGESRTGVEIKHDENYATTGNLYIEVAEKASLRDGPFAPSGILRDDNTWLYADGRYPIITNGRKTSQGFLLPEADAKRFAAAVIDVNEPTELKRHCYESDEPPD